MPVLAFVVAAPPEYAQANDHAPRTVTIAFELFPPDPDSAAVILDTFTEGAVGIVTDAPGDCASADFFHLRCGENSLGYFNDHGDMLFVTKDGPYKLCGYVHEVILPANRHGFMVLGPQSGSTIEAFWVTEIGNPSDLECIDPDEGDPNFWGHLLIVVTGTVNNF